MTVRTFAIRHANIMTAHITNDDEGLIIINEKWENLDPMLKRDVIGDLKADLDSIFNDVQEEFDEFFHRSESATVVNLMPPEIKQNSNLQEEQSQILKLPEVLKLCCISRATVYAQINAGTFPAPIKLGKRSVGWVKEEIQAWINKKINQTRPHR